VTRSHAPSAILVTVTPLLVVFGSTRWSWLGGPVASLAVWALGHVAREPATPSARAAAVRRAPRRAATVDNR